MYTMRGPEKFPTVVTICDSIGATPDAVTNCDRIERRSPSAAYGPKGPGDE